MSRGDQTQDTCLRQTRTFAWQNQPSHHPTNKNPNESFYCFISKECQKLSNSLKLVCNFTNKNETQMLKTQTLSPLTQMGLKISSVRKRPRCSKLRYMHSKSLDQRTHQRKLLSVYACVCVFVRFIGMWTMDNPNHGQENSDKQNIHIYAIYIERINENLKARLVPGITFRLLSDDQN